LIAALGSGFGDMHRAAADNGSTACACAQFCQGHPNRHAASLSSPAAAAVRIAPVWRVIAAEVQKKVLSSIPFTMVSR
jgi:hypothetical protein